MKTVVLHAQQKWECLSLTRHTEATLLEAINEAGQMGWELVTACNYKDAKGSYTWTAFLKRPSAGQPAKSASESASSTAQATAAATAAVENGIFRPATEDDGQGYDVKAE